MSYFLTPIATTNIIGMIPAMLTNLKSVILYKILLVFTTCVLIAITATLFAGLSLNSVLILFFTAESAPYSPVNWLPTEIFTTDYLFFVSCLILFTFMMIVNLAGLITAYVLISRAAFNLNGYIYKANMLQTSRYLTVYFSVSSAASTLVVGIAVMLGIWVTNKMIEP